MRTIGEHSRQGTAAIPLAEVLYPGRSRFAETVASVDHHGHRSAHQRTGTPLEQRSRDNTLSCLLRDMTLRIAAWRERRAVTDRLSKMSDHELADIGLSRAQIHCAFDPEFARAQYMSGRW